MLRRDRLRWPDGTLGHHTVLEARDAAVVAPVDEDGMTVLVRQWRHSWGGTSWELPAGTLEPGEAPEAAARRELAEEAGLEAAGWTPLGTARGMAVATIRYHLFLARGLRQVDRAPEFYEQDMIVQRIALTDAVAEAVSGGIPHAVTVTALFRAARALGLA